MKKKQKIDYRIVIVGLLCITALEIVALLQGINGVVLTSVVAIIALAIGVAVPTNIIKK